MRGVSLEEISTATKISLRFLEAIEREDFAKLPGGIFSRSFIRSYARYLGLDEDRVVEEFHLAARPQVDFDLHRLSSGKSTSGRPGARTPLIGTLVAAILLAGGYALFRYSPRPGEVSPAPPPAPVVTAPPAPVPAAAAPVTVTPAEATPVPMVNPPAGGTTPGVIPGPAPVNRPSPLAVSPAGAIKTPQTAVPAGTSPAAKPAADSELVLQVAATDRAWVAVDADGKTKFQRVLNPNEVETVKARNSLDVTTGNALAIILTLNGETLKPLGRRGEVKSVHLTHDDLKNPAP